MLYFGLYVFLFYIIF